MATAKPKATSQPRRPARRAIWWLALAALALLAWNWRPLNARAVAAASYGARMACSCRFVAGRELSDCRKDFEPGMGLVMLSGNDEEKSVTARLVPLASETATYREGWGCVLEPWKD